MRKRGIRPNPALKAKLAAIKVNKGWDMANSNSSVAHLSKRRRNNAHHSDEEGEEIDKTTRKKPRSSALKGTRNESTVSTIDC